MAELFKLKYIKYKNKYNVLKKQLTEVDLNQTDLDLTDTPSKEAQVGGTAPVSTPPVSCAGVVNPMPSVLVPMNQDGGSCAGIVNPAPVISPPVSLATTPPMASMKNDVDSDVNNTEDIERLFKQIGGKKHHKRKSSESSKSSLFDSESSSLFGSDFDEALSLCDD